MKMALAEADKGRGAVEPNPIVGAVVVREGRAVGQGHHARFGGPHAEVVALDQAAGAARGATMYVTLEPCCHHGRTPPCTDAILAAGVARVVVGCVDPFPAMQGKGLTILAQAGVDVVHGVWQRRCERRILGFSRAITVGLPEVTLKAAISLDGNVATATGESRWITGEEARADGHR